jgi:hypothetical protein
MKQTTHNGPSFACSRFEHDIINRIADRAVALARKHEIEYEKMTATMDLTACHCNGMALDLAKLESADEATFAHDVFGIRRHIDRRSGIIGDCFVPRAALAD